MKLSIVANLVLIDVIEMMLIDFWLMKVLELGRLSIARIEDL